METGKFEFRSRFLGEKNGKRSLKGVKGKAERQKTSEETKELKIKMDKLLSLNSTIKRYVHEYEWVFRE